MKKFLNEITFSPRFLVKCLSWGSPETEPPGSLTAKARMTGGSASKDSHSWGVLGAKRSPSTTERAHREECPPTSAAPVCCCGEFRIPLPTLQTPDQIYLSVRGCVPPSGFFKAPRGPFREARVVSHCPGGTAQGHSWPVHSGG